MNINKIIIATFAVISLLSASIVLAEDDNSEALQKCVSSWKSNMKNPLNSKVSDEFASDFCKCSLEITAAEPNKSKEAIVAQCISSLIAIGTVSDLAENKKPQNVNEVHTQCFNTAMSQIGTQTTSKSDASINNYCSCASPKIYEVMAKDPSVDELKKKILETGEECAQFVK